MLMIKGVGRARAGKRGELLIAAARVAESSRADEGCLSYGFYTDIEDPDTVLSLEVWRDESALAAHMGHQHTITFLALAADLLEGTPVMSQHMIDAPAAEPTRSGTTSNVDTAVRH